MGGILFKVDGQPFQQCLPFGTLDSKATVPQPLFHCREVDRTVRLSAPQHEAELARGGHHGLHIVQMPSVLRQQHTDGGVALLFHPLAIEKPVVLKGLFGVQRQQFHLRHAFQHTQQRCHPSADTGFRQHVQVGGLHKVKRQLAVCRLHAAIRYALDAHQLSGGLFLSHVYSLHS